MNIQKEEADEIKAFNTKYTPTTYQDQCLKQIVEAIIVIKHKIGRKLR